MFLRVNGQVSRMEKWKLPKIGMRNIKTGCSVFLTLLLSYVLQREDPFFGCIAAVICLQQTSEKTWNAGVHRWIGTCIGGLIGFFVMLWLSNIEHYETIRLLVIPAGVCLLIYLCVVLHIRGSASICCIVFINVVLHMDRTVSGAAAYVFNRVIDTFIGIICAGIVQYVPEIIRQKREKADAS